MFNILSFSTNREILPIMDRLVNKQEGWTGQRAPDLAAARELLLAGDFSAVLLGAGTGEAERNALQILLDATGKKTVLIDHYGGGSGLLYAEVMEALG